MSMRTGWCCAWPTTARASSRGCAIACSIPSSPPAWGRAAAGWDWPSRTTSSRPCWAGASRWRRPAPAARRSKSRCARWCRNAAPRRWPSSARRHDGRPAPGAAVAPPHLRRGRRRKTVAIFGHARYFMWIPRSALRPWARKTGMALSTSVPHSAEPAAAPSVPPPTDAAELQADLSTGLSSAPPTYLPLYLLLFGLLSVAATLAARSYLPDWQLVNAPLHTVAEASGALAALLLAFTIVVSPERDPKLHPYIVAAALVAMSLLDLAHAAVPVGGLSVWLRSMATLLGGTLFALTWLPPRPLGRPQRRATLGAAVALAVLCAALPMGLTGAPPAMLEGGAFTPLAKAINLAGGLGFLAACLRYCLLYRRQCQTGHLLNANFCFLFGFSGLLLPYSEIWGVAWWYWHLLRLAGYLLILTHILLYIRRTNAALIDSVQTLTTASERLRLATTAGGIGIWDWDAAGDVLLWDAQLYRLYGVAPDSFEATLAGWLACVTPQDRAATRAAFDAALRGEREYAIEFRIDWPDGSQRHIAAAGQAYFGADGRATRMLG